MLKVRLNKKQLINEVYKLKERLKVSNKNKKYGQVILKERFSVNLRF